MQIAIDGPAGVGKTTIGWELAKKCGFLFLESGRLYRAAAYTRLKDLQLEHMGIEITRDNRARITVENSPLGEDLQSEEIGEKASQLAREKSVRRFVTHLIRDFSDDREMVIEGRDIGTVVLPEADLKIYLTAAARERARRRQKQLGQEDQSSLTKVTRAIQKRDNRDKNRSDAPLKPAEDAIIIDTTSLSRRETLKKVVHLVDKHKNCP
ncbi:MAG: (d)CMP kinase [Candidatus Bipolaricaulota bacterium]